MNSQVWCFDCEWAPDLTAGRRLLHLGPEIPDDEVMRQMYQASPDYDAEKNPQPFLKTVLCRVVSIVTVVRKVSETGAVTLHLWRLPENPDDRNVAECDILRRYLEKFAQSRPLLVGYNSKNADMHILAQRAIVNGLSLPAFATQVLGKPWEMDALDLMEVVGGRARSYNCSLHEIATLCGIPGKLDTTGQDVAAMFYGDRVREIVDYNTFDAFTTYLLWLRVEHFRGTFDAKQYAAEQERVRAFLVAARAQPGGEYLRKFIDAWDACQSP